MTAINDPSSLVNCAAHNGGGFWHNEYFHCGVNTLIGFTNNYGWPVYVEGLSCSHLECGCSVSKFNISVDTTDSAQPLNLVLQPH